MKCSSCKTDFEPYKRNGIILSKLCTSCLIAKGKQKQNKDWKQEKKAIKERLKTHSEWLNDLQKVFNSYVRARDKNKPCISCGCKLGSKFDASHFYSVGSNPYVRFNESNVHGACVTCNQHKHGNLLEYAERLPQRIGKEAFEQLKIAKNEPLKLTTEEIKKRIIYYKNKLKQFNT